MSVVVYRDGVMAADSRAYSGTTHPLGNKTKIHRLSTGPYEGFLVGICSNVVGMPEEFKAWLERGASREDWAPSDPSFEALLVDREGQVYLFSDTYFCAGPITAEAVTIGSGKKYALGALTAGADVIQAVEAAIACDLWCGGPVAALRLTDDRAGSNPA